MLRFGQCLWIKDAELDTERPSGQVEQAWDTHPQGHVPVMSLAPLSENLHYYLCGEFLALMHFCKLYISVQNFVVPFLSHHHPMKLFPSSKSGFLLPWLGQYCCLWGIVMSQISKLI